MLRRSCTALVFASLVAVAGCEGGTDEPPTTGVATTSATVQFVNATTGGSSFDLLAGGTATTNGAGLAYQGISSCVSVNAGAPNLSLQLSGTTSAISGFTPTFQAGLRYTIVAVGTQPASPSFLTFADNYTTPAAGRALLRIINATTSQQGASLDVYFTSGTTLVSPNATALAAGSATSFLDVPSGATRVRLTTAGTQTVVLDVGTLTLASGAVQSIVVTDPAAGSTALRFFTTTSC
jgi:hypothetical protein